MAEVRMRPSIFIGSSKEGLLLATKIKRHLTSIASVDVWENDVFRLGAGVLESLFAKLRSADFAVLVCTPDDDAVIREKRTKSMRDNVLFELGLFMGGLGRSRAYGVVYRPEVLKIPSDLDGITVVRTESIKGRSPDFTEAAKQVGPKLSAAIRREIAESRRELAREVDCRMLFLLRNLEDDQYKSLPYYTGVLRSFVCHENTPEELRTGTNAWEEVAKYTVRVLRALNLVRLDEGQIAITPRGKDIVEFCKTDREFRRRHDAAFSHPPYDPRQLTRHVSGRRE
jgi:hypothetical protein